MPIRAERVFVGAGKTPVLTLDGAGPPPDQIVEVAAALAPFAPAANNYPGLRRCFDERDGAAWAYAAGLMRTIAPYLAGAFELEGFDLVEASFSLVTTPSAQLKAVQRTPHFDSVDADLYAVLHYLAPCGGTAFYRHRSTGLEIIRADTADLYVAHARRDAGAAPADYIRGDTAAYQCLSHVEGRAGRIVAYPARLLHSGCIPPGFRGSADPRAGRLTANFFVRAHPAARA